ncbi:hypothetical protein FH972_019907 [Carpinus fangiana]|uniref:AAA+ ATPase domain-containing protein n=1 Tax=Carpinus fangiana TaxID=176857 RepID=A0A5N6RUT0_9ROSI|nr:hypothetical protein FH972_019907 [Carpinus fangiana]
MEILIAIAAKIVEYTVAPIGQWLCYSFHYSSNIGSMKKQVEKLRLARDTKQHSIDAAIRNGEAIEGLVNNWLKEVDEITELAMKVVEGEEEAKTRRSNAAACLDLKLRHQLSYKAKKIAQAIDEVLENCNFVKVSYRPAPQGMVTTRSTDYVDSNSRKSTVTRLMEALRDDNIHVIGVWGMAGVGKSTLVREVANQAMEKKLFEEVAIGNVTQSADLRRIQGEIADMLDLNFDVETVNGRANCLLQRLRRTKHEKKILVILDDMWTYLDLKAIGIPTEECKVLLTSRDREVFSGMDTQKNFELEVLDEEEAWSLFEKKAGNCVKDPNLGSTAIEVAKECAGLPLALVTVSKALKNKKLYEWKNALKLLRKPAPGCLTTMQSKIYHPIELSYNHLENKEIRDVFLLCSQLGYSIRKRDLLKYCYGLGLFHGNNTMEDVRDRLDTILRILKDCCLLLDYSVEILCMHGLVRDVATLIASTDHNMFVLRNVSGLKEWPNADALKRCMAFSIRGGDIHELPNEMECPELRFFCLCGEDRPLQISDSFFGGMGKLKVLDLTKMELSSLPSSLCLLRNLQTLCLDQCVLRDITVIGELKNLAILSFLYSNISQLPREIGLLSRLRLLDLRNCSKLEVIPPNVLSSLVALEELYMGNSFVQWETEGLNNGRNNASLAELKHLSHLVTLEIQIPNANSLPKDLLFEKLERFVLYVGDEWDWSDRQEEASNTLKLKLNTNFQSEVGIKNLLKRTKTLYLDELKGVKSALNELDWDGFQQLKHLHIQNNLEIKYIMNSTMSVVAFPALEIFHLKNMTSLEGICHGQLPLRSFGNMRVLKVEHCDKLKYVFSSSTARGLSQLEKLEIRKCSIMGAIVMKEEGEIEGEHTSLFPQLRHLELEHLSKLKSFLSTQNSLVAHDGGEIISEGKPDFYMPILREQVVFPNLEKLVLSSMHLEDVQHKQRQATRSSCRLQNMQSMSRFQNLLDLTVQGPSNIKYLLSFSEARYMMQLKCLHILECEVMEEILVTEDQGVVEEIISELFSRLEFLSLKELPILKRFCEGSNIKFPSLKVLVIEHCPNLQTFISKPVTLGMTTTCKELKEMKAEGSPYTAMQPLFDKEVAFPSLERLLISNVDDLKIIWGNQFAVDSFYKLQGIIVIACENLVSVVPYNMLARFQSLEELIIRECGSLQQVFEVQGINVKETHDVKTIQLKELLLVRLPKMIHVWNKDAQEIFHFRNLKEVRAMECESLKSLFPASVATCLTQLEQLVIVNCDVLEEIVAGEEAEQPIARFVFPRLTVLHLAVLPRLKWFYPGVYTSEWPMLKDMLIASCPKVEILACELSSFQEIRIKKPLLLLDEVHKNLN